MSLSESRLLGCSSFRLENEMKCPGQIPKCVTQRNTMREILNSKQNVGQPANK